MYSGGDNYGQLSCFGGASEFRMKETKDWDSTDCWDWANEAQQTLNIPLSSWLSIDRFKYLTGRELLKLKSDDFCRILDDTYGPRFYKLFRKLVKDRREDSEFSKMKTQERIRHPSESSSWLVPGSYCDSLNHTGYPSPNPGYLAPSSIPLSPNQDFSLSPNPDFSLSPNPDFSLSPNPYLSPTYDENSMSPCPTYATLAPMSIPDQYEYSQGVSSPFPAGDDSLPSCLFDPHLDSSDLPPIFSDQLQLEDDMDSYFDNSNCEDLDVSELDKFVHVPAGEESVSLDNLIDQTDHLSLQQHTETAAGFSMHPEVAAVRLQQNLEPDQKALKKVTTGKRKNRTRNPRSWEFIVRLLIDPATNPSLVKWENKEEGKFRLVKKDEIARLWGSRSDRHKTEDLSYENFARILRYHYKKGLLHPVEEKHLVYKLGDKVLADLRQNGVL